MKTKPFMLLALILLVLPVSTISKIFPARSEGEFLSAMSLGLFILPSLALIAAGLLLVSSQRSYSEWRKAGRQDSEPRDKPRRQIQWAMVGSLVLGLLLLVVGLVRFYWLMVWDLTYDPWGNLWLLFMAPGVLVAGILLMILLEPGLKWAGIGYALSVAVALVAIAVLAQQVNYRQLTEKRAGRVSQAVEEYAAREGHYPASLRQLFPRDVLALPEPVIIFGQDWCYDSGDGYFRLGYVDREHWSDPRLIEREYKRVGEAPVLKPLCAQEVAAIQARYPESPYTFWVEGK